MKQAKGANKDRGFAAILEKIYGEIKVLGEGQSLLRDKLDATMGMTAKNREDITMLTIRTSGIKDELEKINGKLAKIEIDITLIKDSFGNRIAHLEESLPK